MDAPTLFPLPREAQATVQAVAWVGRRVRPRKARVVLPHLPYLPYRSLWGFSRDLAGPGRVIKWRRLAINHWQIEVYHDQGIEVYP